MGSELIALLEKEAAAERERVLAEAKAQAEEVRAAAEAEAAQWRDAQQAEQEAALRAARVRAQSAANLQAQAILLEAKDRALDEVFQRAGAALEAVVQDRSRYGRLLERLLREAAEGFPGEAVVEVHPDDLERVRAAVRREKIDAEVRAADDVRGGVRLVSADGRFVVLNALPFRLERARPALVSEVARLLWA